MSPPPRSTPTPTLPPEPPISGIRNKLRAFVTDVKTIVVGLMVAGGLTFAFLSSLVTQTELSRAKDWGATQHQLIRDDVAAAVKRLDTLDEGNRWRDATLKAIADRLNVYVPPPPSMTTGAP